MNLITIFHMVFTVAIFIAFIGVVAWAYSRRRHQDFTEAAQLPLVDDAPPARHNMPNEDAR